MSGTGRLANRDIGGITKMNERTGNVYENKGKRFPDVRMPGHEGDDRSGKSGRAGVSPAVARAFLRFGFSKVCHSERSEESALVRFGPERQILRFAQDDSAFCPLRWGAGPWKLPTSDEGGWDFAAWRETGFFITKPTEQSQNVYENKEQDQKVNQARGRVGPRTAPATELQK